MIYFNHEDKLFLHILIHYCPTELKNSLLQNVLY